MSTTTTTRTRPAPVRQSRRPARNIPTLVAVALASMMLPLTVTGTAVVLTTMATDLRTSVETTQWVLNAYNVAFAACLLAAGGLADRFGRRRVMVIGVITYVITSLVTALANNIILIDVARGLAGVGAAAILAGGAAVLAGAFEGPRRARAFGILGTSFGFGLAAGPLAAGALVAIANWRAFFLLNVVAGVAVFLLSPRIVETRDPAAGRVDWGGLVTFSTSLFLLALGFVEGPLRGWSDVVTLASFVGAAVFMLGFVIVESRVAHPMFDLSLFKRPTFVAVMAQPFTIVFGFVILVVYLPPYLQGVGGHGAAAAGVLLLPLMLPVLVLPMLAGLLASRIPLRVMLASSSLLIALGVLWLTILRPEQSWLSLLGPLLVFGIGVGIAFGVMDNAAVSSVPVERAGMAAGMFNTMRITGESVAVAGAAALLASVTLHGITDRVPGLGDHATRVLAGNATQGRLTTGAAELPAGRRTAAVNAAVDSLTSGMHVTFAILAVLALIGAVATFLTIRDKDLNAS